MHRCSFSTPSPLALADEMAQTQKRKEPRANQNLDTHGPPLTPRIFVPTEP